MGRDECYVKPSAQHRERRGMREGMTAPSSATPHGRCRLQALVARPC